MINKNMSEEKARCIIIWRKVLNVISVVACSVEMNNEVKLVYKNKLRKDFEIRRKIK